MVVENLLGDATSDLAVGCGPFTDLVPAHDAAAAWCADGQRPGPQRDGRVHSETSAMPAERLATERAHLRALPTLRPAIGRVEQRTVDHLRTVRVCSARYSVPGALIGKHVTVIVDASQLVIRHGGIEVVPHELVVVDELGLAPLDDVGTQLLFRFVAAAYERRSLRLTSRWPFESWDRFLPEHATAVSLLDRPLHDAVIVITEGESFRKARGPIEMVRRSLKGLREGFGEATTIWGGLPSIRPG